MINKYFKLIVLVLITVFISFFGLIAFNYNSSITPQIVVSGSASQDFSNQIAEFNITFTSKNKDKAKSEEENTVKVNKFLDEVKNFGITEKDIITESINSFQEQESYQEGGVFKSRPGDWVFSQSIRIKVKEIQKVNDFVTLLGKNPTSNVYGPNFSVDNTTLDESKVYQLAFDNAKNKAEKLAEKSGRKLGKVIFISESQGYSIDRPIPLAAKAVGMGGAEVSAQLPAGTSSVSKTLQVIFELK